MKRTALAGLFISAAMLASPVFAGSQDDLCQINQQKIKDALVSTKQMSSDLKNETHGKVEQAKREQAKGTKEGTENCISLTNQVIQQLQNNTKGDQQ